VKVGGEIESYCTSCKAIRWHIIIAMVEARPAKVECMSCHKQHTLRTAGPRARRAAPKPAATLATPVLDLDQKLRGREASATGYDPQRACALDEVIRHPTFGIGVVVGLPAPQRMEVAFRVGRKFLVHALAGGGPRLKRPDQHAADVASHGASDAPPAK
jgi:hypothetical protein